MSVLETSRPKDILTFLKAITFGPTYTLPLLINNIQLTTQVWCRRADWECGQPWCDLEPGCWTNPRTNYKWVVRWEEVTAFHSPGRETIRMWLFHTVGLRSSRCQTSAWRFRPTNSQVTSSVQEAFLKNTILTSYLSPCPPFLLNL